MFKFKTVLAFTLVIFIVSLCVPSVFAQAPQRGRRPQLQNHPRAQLNILDLTDEQKEQLKNLRENQREVQKQFMDKTKSLRLDLNELKQDAVANSGEIEKIQDEIFNLRIEQMKNAYMHKKEIKKMFTPEQLEKMSVLRTRSTRGKAVMNRRAPQRNQFMKRGPNRGRGHMFDRTRFFRRGFLWRRR